MNKLWSELEKFGKYSFNRSHSFAYSKLGYHTMWLKMNYPSEFVCSALTAGSASTRKENIKEAYRLGLKVILPKIGISDSYFWRAKDKKIYCPFIDVKGIGEKTALAASESKPKAEKKRSGFFNTKKVEKKYESKLDKILSEIGTFNEDEDFIPKESKKYFDFDLRRR